jgi:hypothetical protein
MAISKDTQFCLDRLQAKGKWFTWEPVPGTDGQWLDRIPIPGGEMQAMDRILIHLCRPTELREAIESESPESVVAHSGYTADRACSRCGAPLEGQACSQTSE